MKLGLLFSIVLVVSAFFLVSFILYDLAPGETQRFFDQDGSNTPIVTQNVIDDFPNGILFYPNLRFTNKQISYYISETCEGSKADDSRKAFQTLTEETSLNFHESPRGDIKVSCSEAEPVPEEGFFVAGEGGPNSIINASNFYIINNGTILLYRENKCSKPIVAIHEILHVLGFKHSSNQKSIMHEVSNCNQQLTKEIIETIDNLYKYETLPDLTIREASATKSGKRIEFSVEIFNSGLDMAFNSKLGLFTNGELISEYEIGELEIGSGKIITVGNLRVPRNLNTLTFKVDHKETIFEISEDNNEKTFAINE
ncbi:hypothetical protein CMI46_00235 [Candidatus Pacearchaeota archaeon]|nr:hypothetical protein [Candidatus Pacearchaeota archaeon]|tara:strand:- start:125 stop:1060 length:936 start_codon:yes stop_codon:yes gene_type:complete